MTPFKSSFLHLLRPMQMSLLQHLVLLALAGAPPLPPSLLYLSSFFHSSWMRLPLPQSRRSPEQRSNLDLAPQLSVPSAQMGASTLLSVPPQIEGAGRFSSLFPGAFIARLQRIWSGGAVGRRTTCWRSLKLFMASGSPKFLSR